MSDSNIERSGDRDLYISGLLRRVVAPDGKLRNLDYDSLDGDPQTICDHCKLPFVLMEFTRSEEWKPTTYTVALARKVGVQTYCVWHDGDMQAPASKFVVHTRPTGKEWTIEGEDAFIAWILELYEDHQSICEVLTARRQRAMEQVCRNIKTETLLNLPRSFLYDHVVTWKDQQSA